MITLQDVEYFLEQHDYDVRKSGNGRWIDQKCTPDVIWSVADFVLDYVDNVNDVFSVKDIWQSDYAKETIAETFSKPGTDEETAKHEYDKVFSEPLSMFCYAGIIEDISNTRRHLYKISNREILEYISRNDTYSLRFLCCYIEKVLNDSNLLTVFNDFFENQDQTHFNITKETFINFYHNHTPIKKEYEPKRIFTKVINPLAFKRRKKGSEKGYLSSDIIKKSDMMYNRDNFRDVYKDKPKGVSRQEWLATHPNIDRRDGYFEHMMSHSKKLLKKLIFESRDGISELTQFIEEQDDMEKARDVHHIFPKNEFPEIMYYLENLIALTPNQHYGYAHLDNPQMVDIAAQKVLLIAKTNSIKENLMNPLEEKIYEFSKLLFVLSVGWNDKGVLEIKDNDYADVLHSINYHYENI